MATLPAIKDDIAVFTGYREISAESGLGVGPRVFAVKAPGPAVDITLMVWRHWSKASGRDLGTTLRDAQIGLAEPETDGVSVGFSFGVMETHRVHLSWAEVADIIREVEQRGVQRKDSTGVTYVEPALPDK